MKYKNYKKSGIDYVGYVDDLMVIAFKGGGHYTYTTESVGKRAFNKMRKLADKGKGLNTFINKNRDVRASYVGKEILK